jgi:hypothetical protein
MFYPSLELLRESDAAPYVDALDKLLAGLYREDRLIIGAPHVAAQIGLGGAAAASLMLRVIDTGLATLVYDIRCPEHGEVVASSDNLHNLPIAEAECPLHDHWFAVDEQVMWYSFRIDHAPLAEDGTPKSGGANTENVGAPSNVSTLAESSYFTDKFAPEHYYRPVADAEYQPLLDEVNNAGEETKGRRLEDLAKYLLDRCELLEYQNRDHDLITGEIDLFYRIRCMPGTLFQDWGSWLVVECKNWNRSIGVEQIDHFGAQTSRGDSNVGIMFAVPGVSGDKRRGVDGREVIKWWWTGMKRRILVVDNGALDQVSDGFNMYTKLGELDRDLRFPPKSPTA